MIVIAILAIPFIFYFVSKPDYSAMGRGDVGQIYGRKVTQLEIDRNARLGGLAQGLGMSDFWGTLSGSQPGNAGYGTFAVNLIVLRHEAERLGLRPDASEIADVVRKLPTFQSESGFDMNKFTDFVRNQLPPMGLGEEHIEQVVRDELCMNEIKKLLAVGITVSKGELDENFQRGYDKFYVNVIRFQSADFDKGITVNDEDVQKYYDAHKAELKAEEKRKVQFVQLALTEEQKKLKGKERIEVLQKLSDRATDFTQALLEKSADFKQAAGKFQLSVHETGEFTAAASDPQLKKIVDALTKSRARELMSTKGAEVAQQLREAAKSGQPLEAAIQKAGAKSEKLPPFSLFEEEQTKSEGKEPKNEPLSQGKESKNEPSSHTKESKNEPASQGSKEPKNKPALQGKESKNEPSSQGKEPKNEPPSKSNEPTNEPSDLAAIKEAVAFLSPGEISDFSPSGDDGFIAVLEKREPAADADAGEKKATFEKRLLDNKERIVFYEWLHDRQQAAGPQFSKG